jgi:hypothetical protein
MFKKRCISVTDAECSGYPTSTRGENPKGARAMVLEDRRDTITEIIQTLKFYQPFAQKGALSFWSLM